ncbi:FAD-dependent oxidoreductase [Bordetella sp. BOR01]|uniref:FAD-dependent oxidoreductase n=1 Tax=Bordetella sp. BOR01 TaxID=2854779 RepID=UPI001C480869|nr:FAD-dependent oxidoreductase [Bordetella sp. BOR01]MBV7483774.1 FAD-binding protein [Bordetella sp. BOR01]
MNKSTSTFLPDLIIVGGGLAGLTAGVRAAQLGLRPLVLEQGDGQDYPCNSRQSGGILHIGFHDPCRPSQELVDIIERLTGGAAKPELARALAQTGSRLVSWLQGQGTKFMRFNPQEGYRWCMAPPRALRAGIDWKKRGPDLLLRQLARSLVELGGKLQLRTRAEALLIQDGHCVGVRGACDGQQVEWLARHCVLADGGFQANPQLVEQYIAPRFQALFQRGAGNARGDGLRMAQAAGAALTDCSRFYGHLLCSDARHNDQVWPYPEIDAIATAGIVVDGSGRRCVDEGRAGVSLANELASREGQDKLYAVFDASIWNGPGTTARIPANPLLERAGGTILRADSVAELAGQMNVPAAVLGQTLDEYNQALQAGNLQDLEVPRSSKVQPYAIRHLPLMAIPICPGITYTMGGIDIDEHAQVLDTRQQPIPGLFAAGATTGGLEGGKGSTYIGGLIKAGCFGLLAAERIACLEGKSVTVSRPEANQASTDLEAGHRPVEPRPAQGDRVHGLARFPILNMVARHRKALAAITAVVTGAVVVALGWPLLSWYVLPIALIVAGISLVAVLGLGELVVLVTEFLMPE